MRISDWSSDVCSSDLRDDLHRFRRLEAGQPRAAPAAKLVLAECLARLEHDHRMHRLAPPLVGHADDRRLANGRVPRDDALDFGGADILAAADDHVLDPDADEEIALGVEIAEHGRTAWREGVCQYVLLSVVAVTLK